MHCKTQLEIGVYIPASIDSITKYTRYTPLSSTFVFTLYSQRLFGICNDHSKFCNNYSKFVKTIPNFHQLNSKFATTIIHNYLQWPFQMPQLFQICFDHSKFTSTIPNLHRLFRLPTRFYHSGDILTMDTLSHGNLESTFSNWKIEHITLNISYIVTLHLKIILIGGLRKKL